MLGQVPAVVAEALEHETRVLHGVLKSHASSLQSSGGLGKGLPVLIADIPVQVGSTGLDHEILLIFQRMRSIH